MRRCLCCLRKVGSFDEATPNWYESRVEADVCSGRAAFTVVVTMTDVIASERHGLLGETEGVAAGLVTLEADVAITDDGAGTRVVNAGNASIGVGSIGLTDDGSRMTRRPMRTIASRW